MMVARGRGRPARAPRLAPVLLLLLGDANPVAAQGWREGRARDAAAACRDRAEAVVRARGAGRGARGAGPRSTGSRTSGRKGKRCLKPTLRVG